MLVTGVRVHSFKSIDDSGKVAIDPWVTVLVGQNESGKTSFLQALHKAGPVESGIGYDLTKDYPRKGLNRYEPTHAKNPAVVCEVEYCLEDHEVDAVNKALGVPLIQSLSFSLEVKYDGAQTIHLDLPEGTLVESIIASSPLKSDTKQAIEGIGSLRGLFEATEALDMSPEEKEFITRLKDKFLRETDWDSLLGWFVWSTQIKDHLPKFLYFDDYRVLPGKVHLMTLKNRIDKGDLHDEDRTAESLLKVAGVSVDDLISPGGYERVKAKLESISNSVTDEVLEYWKQNNDVQVEFDVRLDPSDSAPFNQGNILYIRIRNQRHRVSVSFDQQSKGFIWFFSFIVWFNSIREQIKTDGDLVLLLDEPGLSVHALAQSDFLKYIHMLSGQYQIIYTTHSPFMIQNDELNRVRVVEDKSSEGTRITENIASSDPKSIFPLQAALGYTIAQNLFIAQRNLLVEGPADLVFLRFFSSLLEDSGRNHLASNVTVVPVGGLDKLPTFIALLGGNELQFVALHDFTREATERLESLARDKLIKSKNLIHYGQFRPQGSGAVPSDVEDMLVPELYLLLFNATFRSQLSGSAIEEEMLPEGTRIVDRLNRYLAANAVELRPSGGFNHYLVASHSVANPPDTGAIDSRTLDAFERLFERVNELLT